MAETLTGSQRLRAFITGKVERITELETELGVVAIERDDARVSATASNDEVARLNGEIAGFQSLADEYVPATAPAAAKTPAKG